MAKEKYETDLMALAVKMFKSKQTVHVIINDNMYGFMYKSTNNVVEIWQNEHFVFSDAVSAVIVTPKHIKSLLEKGIYILDYKDLKDTYRIYNEPEILLKDSFWQDVKMGRFPKR